MRRRRRIDPAAGSRNPLERIPRWAWIGFAAIVLAVTAGLLGNDYMKVVNMRVRDAREWRIDGPPCPTITPADFIGNHRKAPRSFEYEGVRFFRRYGHVECAPVYERGGRSDRFHPVCQFTSPGDLMVRTGQGDFYFQPGPGQPATVSAGRGEPTCVMAAKITLKNFAADNEQLARETADAARR
jgi:hypothetical protein